VGKPEGRSEQRNIDLEFMNRNLDIEYRFSIDVMGW
jgi:hypothetical protein